MSHQNPETSKHVQHVRSLQLWSLVSVLRWFATATQRLDLKLFEWLFHPWNQLLECLQTSSNFANIILYHAQLVPVVWFSIPNPAANKKYVECTPPSTSGDILATISSVLEPPMFGPPFHLRQMTSKPLGPHPWSPPITELMRSDWCTGSCDDHGQNQKITASAESDDLASQLCSSLISSDASVCRLCWLCWDGTISELPSGLLLKVSAWSGLQLVDLCTCKPQPRSFGRSAPQRMAGNPFNEIADMFLETICWSGKFHRNTQEHPRKNTFDWWLSHLQQNNCWSILIIFLFHGKDAHWIWVNPPIHRRHMPIVYHDISWYPLISAHIAPLLLGHIF